MRPADRAVPSTAGRPVNVVPIAQDVPARAPVQHRTLHAMVGRGLTAGDLMTRHLYAVGPDTGLLPASRLLLSKHITGVPVIDEAGYPIGIVSLPDLVDPDRTTVEEFGFDNYYEIELNDVEGHGSGRRIPGGRVREVMTPGVISVSALAPVEEAAQLMIEHQIHRLLVMDGDRLLGILTSLDLARGLLAGTERDRT